MARFCENGLVRSEVLLPPTVPVLLLLEGDQEHAAKPIIIATCTASKRGRNLRLNLDDIERATRPLAKSMDSAGFWKSLLLN
jgi:hypothetical protein